MTSKPLPEQPDEDLVEIVRNKSAKPEHQSEAVKQLMKRHAGPLERFAKSRVPDEGQMAANLDVSSVEHMVADVMWKAIQGFRRGREATFKTFVHRCVQNQIYTSYRRKKREVTLGADKDGRPLLDGPSKSGVRPGYPAHLVMMEAREIGGACLKVLPERERLIFFWGVLADFSHEQLKDLCPDLSPENLRKIKSRATATFMETWVKLGGEKVESLAHGAVMAMSESIDPDKIRDTKARDAYRAWMTSDLAGAAAKMALPIEETRKLLLSAAHDLYQQTPLRTRGAILASVLEIGEGASAEDPLVAKARHTLDLVRAAFGLAPMEAAFHTLGSFVQSRMASASDYDAAMLALGLTTGQFRRLLADDLAPKGDLFKRMARFLKVPVARLRALPRRPMESARLATRGATIDWALVRERTLERFPVRGPRK